VRAQINNAIGRVLLAKRMGKTRISRRDRRGSARRRHRPATVAAMFCGMKCVIYMGAGGLPAQELNVYRMKMLGADVVPGSTRDKETLKEAVNEAMRELGDEHPPHALHPRHGLRRASVCR